MIDIAAQQKIEVPRADPSRPQAQGHRRQPAWQAGRISALKRKQRSPSAKCCASSTARSPRFPACRSPPTANATTVTATRTARSATSSSRSPTPPARCCSRRRSPTRSRRRARRGHADAGLRHATGLHGPALPGVKPSPPRAAPDHRRDEHARQAVMSGSRDGKRDVT